MKKNGTGKCNSERGTRDKCRKNGKTKCKLKRGQKLQMEEKWKEQMQLGRANLTNEKYMEETNAS